MSPLIAARSTVVLTLAVTVVSYLTAGIYLQSGQGGAENAHGVAAILLHVTTGLMTAALAWNAFTTKRGWAVVTLSGALFVYTFVQAATSDSLAAHVPGALSVVLIPAAIATWLYTSNPKSA